MKLLYYYLISLIFYLSPLSMSAQSVFSNQNLIPIADLGKSMAIGLSVTSGNRVFISFPNYDGNGSLALAELKDGELYAYPNIGWNTKGIDGRNFVRVQDLFVDSEDNLWVLDSKPAAAGNIFGDGGGSQEGQFKLFKINTKSGKIEKTYRFEQLDKTKSALNDMVIDVKRQKAYLSDPGLAAIVVLDLRSGRSHMALQNSEYTLADDLVLKYDGLEMKDKDGKPFSSNINGIALTKDFRYFYFKPINKEHLYRIEAQYLADDFLADGELKKHVADMGKVGITHGLLAGNDSNIYLTTSEDYSISYLSPDGQVQQLIQDSRLLWPDSMGEGTDGWLYFTCSQLQRLAQWNDGVDKTSYPYRVYKVKLPSK